MATAKRSIVVSGLLALGGALAFLVWSAMSGEAPAPVVPPSIGASEGSGMVATAEPEIEGSGARVAAPAAAAAGSAAGDLHADPVYRAGLCGFYGRVVDHAGAPVPALRVSVFRFAPDSLTPELVEGAEAAPFDVDIDAGETETGEDGRFELADIVPQGFYAVTAGVGAEVSKTVFLDQTPGPGQRVDVGDIVLDNTGVIVGRVVDDDGVGIAGAIVRALELPAVASAFVPVERLHPEAVVIVDEASQRAVFEVPRWVQHRFEQLPIPTVLSGPDGAFRLTGVPAGTPMVVASVRARLGHVLQRVKIEAETERDVGELRLREGDEAWGRVLDTRGEPVVGAEVVVGQVLSVGPVAVGERAEPTNENGEFSLTGFRGGKVLAAARRGPGEAWTIGEAAPVARDLIIRLPAAHSLTVRVTDAAGDPIESARVRLLAGALATSGDDALEAYRFGVLPEVPLDERATLLSDGVLRIDDLAAGPYLVFASAVGREAAFETVELDGDRTQSLRLDDAVRCRVEVVDRRGEPVRNAAIYAESKDSEAAPDMPQRRGRTDASGSLAVGDLAAGEVELHAHHPAYGWVGAEATLPAAEVVRLVFDDPGAVRGTVTDSGRPPQIGEWMVVLAPEWSEGGNDVALPRLAAPDADGAFVVTGVQPGKYHVMAVPSVRSVSSLGSLMEMMMLSRMNSSPRIESVDVTAGAESTVQLDVAEEPTVIDGPSANVSGTITINGEPGADLIVTTWGGGRSAATADANGFFDLGPQPAGTVHLRVTDPSAGVDFGDGIYQREIELAESNDQHVLIQLDYGVVEGFVRQADGSRVARCAVKIEGQLIDGGRAERMAAADDDGAFRIEGVPAGRYEAKAEGDAGKGSLEIDVAAGSITGVELVLQPTYSVRGTVDWAALEGRPVSWGWLELQREDGAEGGESVHVDDDGSFLAKGLLPGRYRVEVRAQVRKPDAKEKWDVESIELDGGVLQIDRDLTGVVLRPERVDESPEEAEEDGGN